MDKLNYNVSANLYRPSDLKGVIQTQLREDFIARGINFFSMSESLVVKLGRKVLVDLVTETLESLSSSYQVHRANFAHASVEFKLFDAERTLVKVFLDMNYDDVYEDEEDANVAEILTSHIQVFGQEDLTVSFINDFKKKLLAAQAAAKSSLVNWVFTSDAGSQAKTFQITKDWVLDESFYPWIETTLNAYYRTFCASRAQIMVLYGPPGTGKTSFIRDMLCELNLNAYISYDLKILTADSTFVEYVTGSIYDAIVIEDADDLLTAERGDQNKVIAKILNVSDGLIKLPRKKLIFTTNLTNVDQIDSAITRPGRCFDVMEFRLLTRAEAQVAAKVLNVTLLTPLKDKYSLAEIFHLKDIQDNPDPFVRKHGEQLKRKVGFY